MNPFHYGLYQFAKVIVLTGLRVFYPRTQVLNRERLTTKGPAIVATNHPNTLMDPFHAVARIWKPVFFLANAGLFKTRFTNWFFSTLYCIPIERPEDISPGKLVNNQQAFRKINQFLEKGGLLFVAPEGGSFSGRIMQKLKSGSARMTLQAEKANDFTLGAHILPVGLAYSAPRNFRSRLVVNVGEPIWLRDFQEQYEQDPFKTARMVTDLLNERFKALVVCPQDETEETVISRAETLYQNSTTSSPAEELAWGQNALRGLQAMKVANPEKYSELNAGLTHYFQTLEEQGVDDRAVYRASRGKKPSALTIAGIIFSFPLFLYGALNHLFAAGIPALIWKVSNIYITYEATIKYVIGLLTFPLFYYFQFKLAGHLAGYPAAWIYLLTLYPAGVLSWKLWKWYRLVAADRRVSRLAQKAPQTFQGLTEAREQRWAEVLQMSANS